MKIERRSSMVCTVLTIAILTSCHTTGKSKYLIATSSEANNKMMLLNGNVDNFGDSRMKALTLAYPAVASFLEKNGRPRYFAECMDRDDHMIVFYYPEQKKAYGCRYAIGSTTDMEFSGPYPINKQEMEHLSTLEKGTSHSFSIARHNAGASTAR